MRQKKADTTIDLSNKAFPSLTDNKQQQRQWVGETSFSKLANDWQEKDEREAQEKELSRIREIIHNASAPVSMNNLFKLRAQPDFEEEDIHIEIPPQVSEWTDVKKKTKPRKTVDIDLEEGLDNKPEEKWGFNEHLNVAPSGKKGF